MSSIAVAEPRSSSAQASLSTSVIIPAYNVSNCIRRAIASALEQTLQPSEIIVVDDGSSDGTAEIVEQLARSHPEIRLIRQPRNMGPGAARNAAIEAASGEWIALLDADDAYLPERLESLVLFGAAERLTMVADNFLFYDPHAARVTKMAVDPGLIGNRLDVDLLTFVSRCRGNRPANVDFGLLKPVIRREFLVKHAVRYDEFLRHGEDFVFYFQALQAGAKFSILPAAQYVYTERVGTVSGKASDQSRTTGTPFAVAERAEEMAASVGDPVLAQLLLKRAHAIRLYPKMVAFQKRSTMGKVMSILDPDMREYVVEGIVHRLSLRTWRKPYAQQAPR